MRFASAGRIPRELQLVIISASHAAGALDPAEFRVGEWWRLFTAPMLHAGLLHWWLNWTALASLGRDMETRGPGAWVPIVFAASALAGGAFSLALPPSVPSLAPRTG